MYDPFAELTMHVLPNGLEVHYVFWDRRWIVVEVVVHSGGREDPVAMPGLAHFVEHVLSQNIPNTEPDRAREFFEICGGGAMFGSTNYLSTRYKFVVPADIVTFREALTIFGSMLFGARIEKCVEREREIIFREFNERYPFPEKLGWDMEIRRTLFKGHRLETWNRPLGRPEGFLSTTKADLQGFYDKNYVPANVSLVIIGGLKTDEVIAELEKSPFGMQKNGTKSQIPQPFETFPISAKRSRIVNLSDYVKFKVEQSEYTGSWAFPSDFPRQTRRVFDSMLNNILFKEIREKLGIAYGIETNHTYFQDVGEYKIGGMINPNATSHIIETVRKCIEMVPSRRDLFDQMLESRKQRCLMIDLTGQGLAGSSANDLVYHHRIITMKEVWDDLHKITFEQMAEATSLLCSERQYNFITCP